jgi:hypothetical protein
MSTPTTKIYDIATGKEIIREMTADEIANLENVQASAAEEKRLIDAKAADRIKLLEKLGLTEDEAAILLS